MDRAEDTARGAGLDRGRSGGTIERVTGSTLPSWRSVLAVTAHPDDESFGLGAVLDRFQRGGARTSVLCFTRGEASTLGEGPLADTRTREARRAAGILGVGRIRIADHPDGELGTVPPAELAGEVRRASVADGAEGLLAFDTDGVTGHRDHVAATTAAVTAAAALGIPVLGWTVPDTVGRTLDGEFGTAFGGRTAADLVVPVDRTVQRRAIEAHASQANPVVRRRLELCGDREWLVWLHRPDHG